MDFYRRCRREASHVPGLATESPLPEPAGASGREGSLQRYVDQRAAQDRPVSPGSRSLLERAQAAVCSKRARIPLRGNVASDIGRSGQQAPYRTLAARSVVQSNLERLSPGANLPGPGLMQLAVLEAACVRVAGAGNCHKFSRTALLEMGARLKRGERAVVVASSDRTHAFVEVASRRRDGSTRSVVVDAWANGPPVLKEDCAYARHSEPTGVMVHRAAVGRRAVRAANGLVAAFNSDGPSVHALATFLQARATLSARHPGGAITIVHPELATIPDPPAPSAD